MRYLRGNGEPKNGKRKILTFKESLEKDKIFV